MNGRKQNPATIEFYSTNQAVVQRILAGATPCYWAEGAVLIHPQGFAYYKFDDDTSCVFGHGTNADGSGCIGINNQAITISGDRVRIWHPQLGIDKKLIKTLPLFAHMEGCSNLAGFQLSGSKSHLFGSVVLNTRELYRGPSYGRLISRRYLWSVNLNKDYKKPAENEIYDEHRALCELKEPFELTSMPGEGNETAVVTANEIKIFGVEDLGQCEGLQMLKCLNMPNRGGLVISPCKKFWLIKENYQGNPVPVVYSMTADYKRTELAKLEDYASGKIICLDGKFIYMNKVNELVGFDPKTRTIAVYCKDVFRISGASQSQIFFIQLEENQEKTLKSLCFNDNRYQLITESTTLVPPLVRVVCGYLFGYSIFSEAKPAQEVIASVKNAKK